MRVHDRAFAVAWLVACVTLAGATPVVAQGALGTLNGRVFDQGDALLPGVTVTATNTGTNVSRTTVTNGEGLYSLPGLEPGAYAIQVELSGFATSTRTGVTLAVNQTLTVDIKLGLAGVSESITVAGASPLIEATQSLVSATVRTREVVNLPLITRNLNGLLNLLPGSKPVAPLHPLKKQWGSVSFGGSAGANVVPTVDGGDNRDNIVGGPLLNFTVEGIEEFQVASHQFSAADGRTGGAAVTILTKSGTNTLRGSGFLLARDRALTAKDYFTARDNLPELPFSRQQFGGSVGGPIVPNRAFFFAAVERIREDAAITVPDRLYKEFQLLVPFGAHPAPGQSIDHPYRETLTTGKTNVQLSQNHSLIARFAHQKSVAENGGIGQSLDLSSTQIEDNTGWDGIAQHSWILGSRALNQFTVHTSHMYGISDWTGLSGGPFLTNYPNARPLPITGILAFPSVSTGVTGGLIYDTTQDMRQIKDSLTLQLGSHSIKMGGDYSWMPKLQGYCCLNWGQLTFFDDPSVIVSNSNGRYPQGFQTPGIVRQWSQGADIKSNYYALPGTTQVKAYFQDDWRVGRRLTLNLGVRYDLDRNFYGELQAREGKSLTGQALRAIGNPYGGFVKTPTKDLSPRVGFAFDSGGDGRRVVRGGYGLYFDGTGMNANTQTSLQNQRPLSLNATRVNSAIGVGQLATYRYGIDPLPPQPTAITTGGFPPGTNAIGAWMDPDITDPHTHQFHVGYSHELAPSTVLSADFTHVTGLNDLKRVDINNFKNGVRRLAPQLAAVYGDPNLLGPVVITSTIGRSRYDELAVQFERRLTRATLRVIYTLSGAYAYAGQISGSVNPVPAAQDMDDIFAPGEWGPTPADERHRVVVFGVFDLPGGIQVSPIFQAATPRPYNLTAGTDLNADGNNTDRYIDPATGQQVSVNSQRGDPFWLVDTRVTKYFTFGRETRRLGVFAEFFNLLNTTNFGQTYNGNGRSVLFRQPIGFIPGSGYPFQVQFGARFSF
jgi:hypothetical protein